MLGLSKSKVLKLISEKEMSNIVADNVFFLVEKTPASMGVKLGVGGRQYWVALWECSRQCIYGISSHKSRKRILADS